MFDTVILYLEMDPLLQDCKTKNKIHTKMTL